MKFTIVTVAVMAGLAMASPAPPADSGLDKRYNDFPGCMQFCNTPTCAIKNCYQWCRNVCCPMFPGAC